MICVVYSLVWVCEVRSGVRIEVWTMVVFNGGIRIGFCHTRVLFYR